MLEKEIENKLRKYVKAKGGLCLKFVSPGFTGVPDRIVMFPNGGIAFVELKAPGKTERPRQVRVQQIFRSLGFRVYSSVDTEEKVTQLIEEWEKEESV